MAATGVDDPVALMGESFIQWVIEDSFIAGRPAWEQVGVEMVNSVDAYEEAKIRLLNATHSCIAWAGTLVNYLYIHEGTQDPVIRRLAFDYVTDDVIPVLDTPERPCPLNLPRYRDVVLDRFANPAICDTNQRVAMDGFSKMPGFIAPTIRQRLAAGATIDSVAMLPALFLAYLQRWHAGKIPYTYQDQAMDPAVAHAMCEANDPVAAFCADVPLWGDLAGDPRLIDDDAPRRRAGCALRHGPHRCEPRTRPEHLGAKYVGANSKPLRTPPAQTRAGARVRALARPGLRNTRRSRLRALPVAWLPDTPGALALPRRVRAAPDHRNLGQGLCGRLDRPVPARPPGADRPPPAPQLAVTGHPRGRRCHCAIW